MNKDAWMGKIKRGRYVERQILNFIRKYYDKDARLPEGHVPQFDIKSSILGDVEVKEDRIAHKTNNYCIEYEDGHGKESGLNVTTSKFWCIVDTENVLFISTDVLKTLIKLFNPITIEIGEKFQKGRRSKGWLLPRKLVIDSGHANVIKRWFPVLQEDNFD